MKHTVLFFSLMLLCISCNVQRAKDSGVTTLKVDLTIRDDIKFDDLFSKVEIIPLATQDSCLIMGIEKVVSYNNQLFVFDQLKPALYVFDEKGNFLKQIGQKGDGPEDYNALTDISVGNNEIGLLSPYGMIHLFNVNGQFIKREILPAKPNYFAFDRLSNNHWVSWSCVEEEEAGISVLDRDSLSLVYDAWHNDRILDLGLLKPFYRYGGSLYFGSAFQNIVYEVGEDSLEMAYEWDFGGDNIDEQKLLSYSKIENGNERNNKILRDLEEGILSYSMENHNQNDLYYYVALRKGIGFKRGWVNVFYRKADHKTYVFEKIEEDINVCPILFTDKYLVSVLSFDNIEKYKKVLSEEAFAELSQRKADDNPCLVKWYFK